MDARQAGAETIAKSLRTGQTLEDTWHVVASGEANAPYVEWTCVPRRARDRFVRVRLWNDILDDMAWNQEQVRVALTLHLNEPPENDARRVLSFFHGKDYPAAAIETDAIAIKHRGLPQDQSRGR